jgi:hypothetical protein
MGAITKRHQGIRHLHKDVTHIQLTLEYDREWKNMLKKYIANWPKPMQSNFELLMTKKDLKDVLITPKHFDLANEVIDLLLRCLNSYRRDYPVISLCESCKLDMCRCSKRYLVNEEMSSKK